MDDFWKNVDVREADDCWEWKAARNTTGYGLFRMDNKMFRAHRLALGAVRDVPENMIVLHKCDNTSCCNPSHLSVGTQKDNMRDMLKKGRGKKAKGQKHYLSKLTESEVHFIKHVDMSERELAKAFDVNRSTIWAIRNGKSWRHVP